MTDEKHFNLPPVRDVEFFSPPHLLKAKVGFGGLSEATLDRAQKYIESNTIDFSAAAEKYLDDFQEALQSAQNINIATAQDVEDIIAKILHPCVQLKANGTMFHYPLLSRVADRFIQFMEVVERLDPEILQIGQAYCNTFKLILSRNMRGDLKAAGDALYQELNNACQRYLDHRK